MQTQEWEKPDR